MIMLCHRTRSGQAQLRGYILEMLVRQSTVLSSQDLCASDRPPASRIDRKLHCTPDQLEPLPVWQYAVPYHTASLAHFLEAACPDGTATAAASERSLKACEWESISTIRTIAGLTILCDHTQHSPTFSCTNNMYRIFLQNESLRHVGGCSRVKDLEGHPAPASATTHAQYLPTQCPYPTPSPSPIPIYQRSPAQQQMYHSHTCVFGAAELACAAAPWHLATTTRSPAPAGAGWTQICRRCRQGPPLSEAAAGALARHRAVAGAMRAASLGGRI